MTEFSAGWMLTGPRQISIPFSIPGDIHSALIANGLIEDPYWRDRETELDWVHEADWVLTRDFDHQVQTDQRYSLILDRVDCVARVTLNNEKIANLDNAHMRHAFDVTDALQPGANRLVIHLYSNSRIAAERAAKAPFPIPYSRDNNRVPHVNFLRKVACHAGWDWNIALMPAGIYGEVTLLQHGIARLDEVKTVQRFQGNDVRLEVTAYLQGFGDGETIVNVTCSGSAQNVKSRIRPGLNVVHATLDIEAPDLWWPAGHGPQVLHDLVVRTTDMSLTRRVGFRQVELDTRPDDIGNRFAFRINGQDIVMRGANWIPADALPSRITPQTVRDRLQSAADAHMNMLRVWGGGQYEPDWFYDLCAEMGILVWQDFMFACNIYPGFDRAWLDNVRAEAVQQVRRLSSCPALALWCGDNELVGALSWFPQTRANRDRYLAMYDRLNQTLETVVLDEGVDVPWWPSSPSLGRLNFGDGWHVDTAGDMHFWDVWHEAKDFEHYRSVRPRFASEFGFQSLPPMALIEQFTLPADRNISSKVMEVHQRNQGGNARIVETLSRYFRFPESFDDMTFLSRLSQGLAMKTAIEFWRAQKPRNMGVLYWQLNDCWPVASWSSLDYGGAWKPVHYLARGFLAPVLITAQPDGDVVRFFAVNDTGQAVGLNLVIDLARFSGAVHRVTALDCTVTPKAASEVFALDLSEIPPDGFLHFHWSGGGHGGENNFLAARPKAYDLGTPHIKATRDDGGDLILSTDCPALFVTVNDGGQEVFDQNCFTLLPDRPRKLAVSRRRHGQALDIREIRALHGRVTV